MLKKLLLALTVTAALAPAAHAGDAPEANPRVEIGWTAWADAEAVSKTAAIVLQGYLQRDVELTLADVSMQYRALENGTLDAMLMSWQPNTHETYLRRHDELIDAGVLYDGARLGLAVPSYVPEDVVRTVGDLAKPEVREKLAGKITGIDPNAGLMGMTRSAMGAYDLSAYTLVEGTGPAMTKALGKAIAQQDWIVVTAWTPHWMFGAHDLRFLEDPRDSFGETEAVHAMVRPELKQDDPELYRFLKRMHFELADLQALMADIRAEGDRTAIVEWIRANPETVRAWLGK